jgi:uncharacterized linocin/CFP29 family protein
VEKMRRRITSNGMITPATNGAIQGMGGTIGERLLRNNMELHSPGMRRNSLLRKDEWLALDSALVGLRPKTINGIFDLMVRGLVYPLGNIGVVIAEWERIYDVQDAEFSMTPETQALEDTLSFDSESVPVPIIHKDFRYELRRLTAARNNGTQLDTTHQEYAGTKVWEAIEGMLFNGVTMKLGTRQIYGYTSYPHRITGSLTAAWDGTATPAEMLADVHAMLAAGAAKELSGPYVLYVPLGWLESMREDYNAESGKTVMQRILQNPEIEAIKPTIKLTNSVVMVEMARKTVDMAVASDIVNVEWDERGGMSTRFKVMAAMAPRLKVDGDGTSGIIHYS